MMESAEDFHIRRAKYIHNDRMATNNSSRGKERMRRVERLNGEYSSYSPRVHNRNQSINCELDVDRPEYAYFHGENIYNNIRIPIDPLRQRPITDQFDLRSEDLPPYPSRPIGDVSRQDKLNYFFYRDEGPSSYDRNGYYEYDERMRYENYDNGQVSTFEDLEKGRVELIRKLDELSWSSDVREKPNGRTGTNQMPFSPNPHYPYPRRYDAYYVQEGLSSSQEPSTPEFLPYADRYRSSLREPHPQRRIGYPHDFSGSTEVYQKNMFQRPQSQYMYSPYHEQFDDAYYQDVNESFSSLHSDENFFHKQSLHSHTEVDPLRLLHNRRSQSDSSNPNDHHHLNPIRHGAQSYSSGGPKSHNYSNSGQSLASNSNDVDYFKNDVFNHHRPRKFAATNRSRQVCHPIAGGAPFITCSKCFQILRLPMKHISLAKQQHKMKCGACGLVILVQLGNEGSTVSGSAHVNHLLTDVDDCSGVRAGGSNSARMNAFSNDHDDSLPEFSPTKSKSGEFEKEKQLDSRSARCAPSEGEQVPEILAPSVELHLTEVESSKNPEFFSKECPHHWSDSIGAHQVDKGNDGKQSEFSQSVSLQNSNKDEAVETEMDISLHECSNSFVSKDSVDISEEHHPVVSKNPEFSSEECPHHWSDHIKVHQFDKGNEGKQSEFGQSVSRQNSNKDEAVATEMDISLRECSNSFVSKDSVDNSEEHHPIIINKVAESFFESPTENISKVFQESDQNVEVGGLQVFVNGKLIPDRMLKKAEILAGPIQPGEYWYDIQAGFWGVMGHPCLGIIMPNIEEFNDPMPENCGGGNTVVFVNGRELHQRDLNLLVSRGLPNTRGRSYLIDMSGKVVDEQTGDELNGLGRLAPTVEKAQRGFGMKVPSFIARLQNW